VARAPVETGDLSSAAFAYRFRVLPLGESALVDRCVRALGACSWNSVATVERSGLVDRSELVSGLPLRVLASNDFKGTLDSVGSVATAHDGFLVGSILSHWLRSAGSDWALITWVNGEEPAHRAASLLRRPENSGAWQQVVAPSWRGGIDQVLVWDSGVYVVSTELTADGWRAHVVPIGAPPRRTPPGYEGIVLARAGGDRLVGRAGSDLILWRGEEPIVHRMVPCQSARCDAVTFSQFGGELLLTLPVEQVESTDVESTDDADPPSRLRVELRVTVRADGSMAASVGARESPKCDGPLPKLDRVVDRSPFLEWQNQGEDDGLDRAWEAAGASWAAVRIGVDGGSQLLLLSTRATARVWYPPPASATLPRLKPRHDAGGY
jgi:hypothetical protein